MNEINLDGLKKMADEYQEKHEQIKQRIEELTEEEKRLKNELERVRNHITYYRSVISDMKKKMKGSRDLDIFDRI
ncbi:MAG: hypothetical protein R6U61_08310 [Thermoplasmata archaeon]